MTMEATIEARWVAAQVGERRFHCDTIPEWGSHADPEVRRQRERVMRRWYAGMLEIPGQRPASVTDYGCGPQSLLLDCAGDGVAVAVDPLRFTDADEAAYADVGVTRVIAGAEDYAGLQTVEGWMYNCLQHTRDWQAALANAVAHTADTFRLFEWVDVPTDALHLHTLETEALRRTLRDAGMVEVGVTVGTFARGLVMPTAFYAGIWRRPS